MPNPEFVAVYCENHEDVLLRKATGKYVGVQVKTRKFDLEPFKATDKAVIRAIGRFAHLEAAFPQWFDEYRFVSESFLLFGRGRFQELEGSSFRPACPTLGSRASQATPVACLRLLGL